MSDSSMQARRDRLAEDTDNTGKYHCLFPLFFGTGPLLAALKAESGFRKITPGRIWPSMRVGNRNLIFFRKFPISLLSFLTGGGKQGSDQKFSRNANS